MFSKRPVLTIILLNLIILITVIGVAEIFLRLYIPYNPGYFTGINVHNKTIVYPWGKISTNSMGFPDQEFIFSNKPRIGYVGDSVNYGMGAGYGYRISEYLEAAYPMFDHWNLGYVGNSISSAEIEHELSIAKKLGINKVVYLFTLNDIMPDATIEHRPAGFHLRQWVRYNFDWLRGKSYLYTHLRLIVKNVLMAHGLGPTGYKAAEMFPVSNTDLIEATVARINLLYQRLNKAGIEFIVMVLPYEMQINANAAYAYAQLNISWGKEFLDRQPQQLIMRYLSDDIPVFDAYFAFRDHLQRESLDDSYVAGDYFVFLEGDRIDWVHPNRKGHRIIADYLIRNGIFD